MVHVKRGTYSKKPALVNFTVNRDCSLQDYDAMYSIMVHKYWRFVLCYPEDWGSTSNLVELKRKKSHGRHHDRAIVVSYGDDQLEFRATGFIMPNELDELNPIYLSVTHFRTSAL